jgi:hypothetical protein
MIQITLIKVTQTMYKVIIIKLFFLLLENHIISNKIIDNF